MPQTHYSVGGSMAVYSVIGRMKTYAITGRAFGNDIVPPHREGFGSIEGAGVVSIEPLLSGAAEAEGSGHLEASVSPNFRQAGNSVSVGDSASEGTGAHTGQPQATGAGSIVLDTFAVQGRGVVVEGVGDPQLDQTGAHNADGSTLTGAGDPQASGRTTLSLLEALTNAGLTSGLKMCLDAGDINSYSGSGQTWTDVSGNASNVTRGANSSAAADDPTYNGTAGELSGDEFWSFDGGDHFRLASANPAWVHALHQDNALITCIAWINVSALTDFVGVFGTDANSANNIGISYRINTTNGQQIVRVRNGSGTNALSVGSVTATNVDAGEWAMIGFSLDEAGNQTIFYKNGASSTTTGAYSSPSSSDATYQLEIGAFGNAINKFLSGTLLGQFALYEGVAFSAANFDSVFALTRGRYGV